MLAFFNNSGVRICPACSASNLSSALKSSADKAARRKNRALTSAHRLTPRGVLFTVTQPALSPLRASALRLPINAKASPDLTIGITISRTRFCSGPRSMKSPRKAYGCARCQHPNRRPSSRVSFCLAVHVTNYVVPCHDLSSQISEALMFRHETPHIDVRRHRRLLYRYPGI